MHASCRMPIAYTQIIVIIIGSIWTWKGGRSGALDQFPSHNFQGPHFAEQKVTIQFEVLNKKAFLT